MKKKTEDSESEKTLMSRLERLFEEAGLDNWDESRVGQSCIRPIPRKK